MKEDGGPAFPCDVHKAGPYGQKIGKHVPGMSLRDWFAGQALDGILAAWYQTKDKNVMADDKMGMFAYWAYGMADAMIAEKDKS